MAEPLLKLGIARNSEIEFYPGFFVYKGEKVLYSDVDGIAHLYTTTRHSVNLIPVGTSHSFIVSIRARGQTHKRAFTFLLRVTP